MPRRRRVLFRSCAEILGWSMKEVAEDLGVSYNHLVLVLEGTRIGSARRNADIQVIMNQAKPLLMAELRESYRLKVWK